MASFPGQTA